MLNVRKMKIYTKFFGRFRKEIGQNMLEWSFKRNITLRELLEHIEKKTMITLIPDFLFSDFSLRRSIILLIDGSELSVYSDVDVKLWDNAEIVLLPAIHGGLKKTKIIE